MVDHRADQCSDFESSAGLPEFLNTWRTLHWWSEQILNYFDDRVTNSFAEGITNRIKILKRGATGSDPFRYRRKVMPSSRRRRGEHG